MARKEDAEGQITPVSALGCRALAGQLHRFTTIGESRGGGLWKQNVSVSQVMNNDNNNTEAYRAAFAEASLELKELFGKIEQLNMRKERIQQVVKVLGKKIGATEATPVLQVKRKTHLPGLTVTTRLTAIKTKTETEK